MIKKSIFLLLFCSQLSISLNAQDLPDLNTVVEVFFKNYHHTENSLKFERRTDGYYVSIHELGEIPSNREKFYDATNQSYIRLELFYTYNKDTIFYNETTWQLTLPKPSPKQQAKNYLGQLNPYELAAFNRQPYYGYSRWYIDVIDFFEKKETLTQDDLNALARAYYQAGANLLAKNSSHYVDEKSFDLPNGQNALSDEQLSAYLYYHDLCIATYEKLIKVNPNYITPVGPVTTKYANEIVDGFLTLLYYQNEEVARAQLQPNIYDDYLLMYARNILQSCPKDAILFTYGDSDNYPLYYVQAMEGFRTDVIIANLSLLVLPRYRSMLLAGPLGAKPLATGLPDFYYEDKFVLWAKAIDSSNEVINLADLYPLLFDKKRYYGEEAPIFLNPYTKGFSIDVFENHFFSKENQTKAFQWYWPSSKNFLYSTSIFQLDMLQANNWERSLCFSLTVHGSVLTHWNHHLILEGLIYRVYPDSLAASNIYSPETGTINVDFNLSFWEEKMAYDTVTLVTDLDKAPFYQASLLSAYKVSSFLYNEGSDSKALAFIDKFILHFPNKVKPWSGSWLVYMDLLEKQKKLELSKTIAETVIGNYEKGLIDKKGSFYYSSIAKIQSFAINHGFTELRMRCERLFM